jgi:uncharacterized cysteine cluster protein YcgN (CxxCxxCC family)
VFTTIELEARSIDQKHVVVFDNNLLRCSLYSERINLINVKNDCIVLLHRSLVSPRPA